MANYRELMDWIGTGMDGIGVLLIVVGALIATWRFLFRRRKGSTDTYSLYRQDLGRAILLGLEFLVAGDIIRTVAVSPTLDNVSVLGLIVLVRTFLSMALELEVEGRWPWQSAVEARSAGSPGNNRSNHECDVPPSN